MTEKDPLMASALIILILGAIMDLIVLPDCFLRSVLVWMLGVVGLSLIPSPSASAAGSTTPTIQALATASVGGGAIG